MRMWSTTTLLLVVLVWLLVSHCHTVLTTAMDTVLVYALTTITEGVSGQPIVAGQQLALRELNENHERFPNFTFVLEVLDSKGDSINALKHALDIVQVDSLFLSNDTVILPIVLGSPWSSMSAITSPTLAAFDFGSISSTATSIALSDTASYPTFFRTAPSDALQAQGVIKLCRELCVCVY